MPQLESAAVGVWVNCGARHETQPAMGISHMLEHMAFKGTERRTARALAEEIEAVGGFLNAYTSREQTAFHARVLKTDVPLAIDILSDILICPAFDPGELERERQVVLQEIGQARDTPDDIVFDHLQSAAYPEQPMGWPILGNAETVGGFSREALADYMHANYNAGGMTVIASGAVDHGELVSLVERHFSALREGTTSRPVSARYAGQSIRVSEELEQVHVAYAFPGVRSADEDVFAAQVYATTLGGGMSSRLFQEAREKRGLCYSIYAFTNTFTDSGFVGIYAGTGETEAAEISAVVAGEMASLAETASEAEVARAKAQIKSGLLMGLERPSARTEQIAAQLLAYGRVLPIEQLIAKIDAVDASAVRQMGAKIISAAPPAMAAIGPLGHLESHEDFCRRFRAGAARAAAE